jgi:O-acetyl-ADP-ribose deacetylase (regulator of RNase III)
VNILLTETTLATGQTLQLVQGDLIAETTDAIVNAANEHLRHGAGVAGAIVRGGGPAVQAESDAWVRTHGPVSHAEPAWTSGGNLPCRYIIHAVGPVWGDTQSAGAGGDEDAMLTAAVSGSLRLADRLGLTSIAFPAISTGIFGFPRERAATVILSAVREYFAGSESKVQLVRIVLYDAETVAMFRKAWATIL